MNTALKDIATNLKDLKIIKKSKLKNCPWFSLRSNSIELR